ncbi:MAG: hypothetical protein WAQ57_00080 [Candidatus Saccharimonadales bacterium]
MKNAQITVRNVDPLLKRRIDKLAKLKSMSINDLVLETLRAKVGESTKKSTITWKRYRGTLEPGALNQSVLDDFEKIDPAMWKDTQ